MDWEQRRRHLVSRPPRDGLARMVAAIVPGSRVTRTRRLGGGLASATHAVDLVRSDGTPIHVVLKRYPQTDESARLEWERLLFAERIGVPSPRPLAVDSAGGWFGQPALVVQRLPGRAQLRPHDLDGWLRQVAEALAVIHATAVDGAPEPVRHPHRIESWQAPDGLSGVPWLDRAVAAVQASLPRMGRAPVLGHGDYHPGNLLWSRGRLSGVVDWSASRISPRGYEVAYCRVDLVLLFGRRAADSFQRHYEGVSGSAVEDVPLYDLVCALNARRWSHLWLHGYREQGGAHLTLRQFRRRLNAHVERSLVLL